MGTVLIVLAALGVGAIVISAYVFTVAARNYVSEDSKIKTGKSISEVEDPPFVRSLGDRRKNEIVQFPLTVNGVLVSEDRRHLIDRRMAA